MSEARISKFFYKTNKIATHCNQKQKQKNIYDIENPATDMPISFKIDE